MPNVMLTHWTQQFSTPGEQAFLGITMLLVGVSLVLIILIAISILVSVMSKISGNKRKIDKNDGSDADSSSGNSVKAKAVIKSASEAAAVSPSDPKHDPAVVAAIAGALFAWFSRADNKGEAGFRIRRIRRV